MPCEHTQHHGKSLLTRLKVVSHDLLDELNENFILDDIVMRRVVRWHHGFVLKYILDHFCLFLIAICYDFRHDI